MIRIIKLKKVDLEKQIATLVAPQRPKLEVEIGVEHGVMWTTSGRARAVRIPAQC